MWHALWIDYLRVLVAVSFAVMPPEGPDINSANHIPYHCEGKTFLLGEMWKWIDSKIVFPLWLICVEVFIVRDKQKWETFISDISGYLSWVLKSSSLLKTQRCRVLIASFWNVQGWGIPDHEARFHSLLSLNFKKNPFPPPLQSSFEESVSTPCHSLVILGPLRLPRIILSITWLR